VVGAALTIIDADGLPALTMRRLAADLGCGIMTLYTYVWDRDDLLRGVVERVLTEIDFHYEPGDTWADVLRRALCAYRAMAERHPAAFSLVAASPVDRAPVAGHLARAVETLVRTGVPMDSAWSLLAIADAFATGLFVVDAATKAGPAPRDPADAVAPEVDSLTQRLRDYAGDDVQRQGVETIIAGAQRTLDLPPAV